MCQYPCLQSKNFFHLELQTKIPCLSMRLSPTLEKVHSTRSLCGTNIILKFMMEKLGYYLEDSSLQTTVLALDSSFQLL